MVQYARRIARYESASLLLCLEDAAEVSKLDRLFSPNPAVFRLPAVQAAMSSSFEFGIPGWNVTYSSGGQKLTSDRLSSPFFPASESIGEAISFYLQKQVWTACPHPYPVYEPQRPFPHSRRICT